MSEAYMNRCFTGLAEGVRVIEGTFTQTGTTKVAAYCRVSTDMEIQQRSLDIQIEAFNKIIREHPGWELAGIYADKGISGTSVRHREEFKRMIEDAKAGKIQYILAKSISRFARNTVDVLTYVRELKDYGVSVYFEKEKLDTGNATSEFLLSIFAANAQEEIISLSNNMKMGRRMRAAAGIAQWTRLYGYRQAKDGSWVIEEKEAGIVRRFFREYLEGSSLPEICARLNEEGIPTSNNKTVWTPTAMANMLHNERYMGDIRIQKTYISDPIKHTRMDNRDAKLKQYYKEDHHPAIISREDFRMAQLILAMKDQTRGMWQYPYYGILRCPLCGEKMVRFNLPRRNNVFAWTCGGKESPKGNLRKARSACPPFFINERYINKGFWEAMKLLDVNYLQEIADGKRSEKSIAANEILRLLSGESQSFPRIEYRNLSLTVKKILFPQWDTMKINWKCGLSSEVKMTFEKVGDLPYPTIERKTIEHVTKIARFMKETYIVNGEPLISSCPDRQIASIRKTQDTVMNLVIVDAKPYEADVPRVHGYRSIVDKEKFVGGDGK